MSWKAINPGVRPRRINCDSISVIKRRNGGFDCRLNISDDSVAHLFAGPSANHYADVAIGDGDDYGWLRITPAEDGRLLRKTRSVKFLMFVAVPPLRQVKAKQLAVRVTHADGALLVRIPASMLDAACGARPPTAAIPLAAACGARPPTAAIPLAAEIKFHDDPRAVGEEPRGPAW